MSELGLDDVQRHSLSGHLDVMGVAKLMGRESAPDTCVEGEATELHSCRGADHGRPDVGPLMTQKSGPIGIPARSDEVLG